MDLSTLLDRVKTIQVVGEISRESISGIHYDSRKVTRNSIFVAIKGFKIDGHKFISDAISRGAIAIVVEDNDAFPDDAITRQDAAKILVKNSREALAELSNSFFDEPSKKIKLVGITGTNGKTTTSYFLKSIFEVAGYKAGLIGTISNFIGNTSIASSLTTPESNDLNSLFSEMYNQGCKYAVMEVSSHSLLLKRVHNISFSAAIFTNLTQDHLDFHENIEGYFQAKKILFDNLGSNASALYNADDIKGSEIIKDSNAAVYSYGIKDSADFKMQNIQFDLNGTSLIIRHKNSEYNISTSFIGDFNAYNACCAFSTAAILGFNPQIIIDGIRKTPQVPGRFEVVGLGNKKVIIDYSHTPDSLEKALLAIRKMVKTEKPVYTVFGCGGDRDKTKRPIMGKIASEISDKVIITSDNPRSEDPLKIMNEIKAGISKANFTMIESREDAIKNAIKFSEDDAVILIAGKGHETYQEIKGIKNHFSDKEVAEKYLNL
ncbi:MAG: UDP-N-acetylmuramoyl-L-alanyl-D-glutamate--2,6-diaminopimelate ligase [Ignavibacteriaceae bacterium]|nr:UDP-N-acetylmuramoyl-L-alanyl-D-glutamate--2,6-diaminopimelate ligase [Ignavibacteriaceae bacterium]